MLRDVDLLGSPQGLVPQFLIKLDKALGDLLALPQAYLSASRQLYLRGPALGQACQQGPRPSVLLGKVQGLDDPQAQVYQRAPRKVEARELKLDKVCRRVLKLGGELEQARALWFRPVLVQGHFIELAQGLAFPHSLRD